MLAWIGVIFVWFGILMCGLGVVGMMRFGDVFNRLHATGLISTIGLWGLLVGAGFLMPSASTRLLALGLFLLVAAPMATHAVAVAAYNTPKATLMPQDEATPEVDAS